MRYPAVAVLVVGLLVFSSVGFGETIFKGNTTYGTKPQLVWERSWGNGSAQMGTFGIWLSNDNKIQVCGWQNPHGFIVEYNSTGDFQWVSINFSGIQMCDLNNYYAVGSDGTSSYLVSYNTIGNVNWSNKIGTGVDYFSIIHENDFIYYTGGIALGSMEEKANIAKNDIYGNSIWNCSWHQGAMDGFNGIAVNKDGDVYGAGITKTPATGYSDILVMKVNKSGKEVWNKTWGTSSIEDTAVDCAVDNDSNFYVCGWTKSGGEKVLLLKYDPDGNLIQTRTWRDISNANAAGMTVDKNKSVYVCGMNGSTSALLIKYDSSGNELWNTSWKNSTTGAAGARDVVVSSKGEIYVVGQSSNNYLFLRKYVEVVVNVPEFITTLLPAITLIALFLVGNSIKKKKI